jgi:hypothetical protein
MKNALFMLLAALTLLASCKKDDSDPEQTKDYVQLKTGNYWIYRISYIDTLGVELLTNTYDSIYISGDTTINGNVYAKKNHTVMTSPAEYLRDSSNYLVNSLGTKMFSPVNFSDTLTKGYAIMSYSDTLFSYFYKMTDKDLSVTVPAGTFTTMNWKGTLIPTKAMSYTEPLYNNYYYSKNVGLVQYNNTFAMTRTKMVWKLVRYKVN